MDDTMYEERKRRLQVFERFYGSIGRNPSDETLLAMTDRTWRVPLSYLRAGLDEIGTVWTSSQREPTFGELWSAIYRAAGFRARYTPTGYIVPSPGKVRWWPTARLPEGSPRGEQWDADPATLGLAAGSYLSTGTPTTAQLQAQAEAFD